MSNVTEHSLCGRYREGSGGTTLTLGRETEVNNAQIQMIYDNYHITSGGAVENSRHAEWSRSHFRPHVGNTPTFVEVQWGTWEGVFLPEGTGMQRPACLGSMEEASVAGVECLEEVRVAQVRGSLVDSVLSVT